MATALQVKFVTEKKPGWIEVATDTNDRRKPTNFE